MFVLSTVIVSTDFIMNVDKLKTFSLLQVRQHFPLGLDNTLHPPHLVLAFSGLSIVHSGLATAMSCKTPVSSLFSDTNDELSRPLWVSGV
jgi:hypothetical protein